MKKLLALVLALVMTLGLATVSSSAAYSDKADIEYTEAADVMTALGVFQGKGDAFAPKDNLNRAEAAKLIAYLMLGNKTAESMTGSGTRFTDVPASHWAAGFIEYLASVGIVSGVGNNQFNPNGQVTAVQFAKMLLVALGYDADLEGFVGEGWSINIQKLANKNDLFETLDIGTNDALTREQAAQMCLNDLKADMVKYSDKGTTVKIGESTVVTGAKEAAKDEDVGNKNYNNSKDANGDKKYLQLAESLYGNDIKLDEGRDDFGRPTNTWNYKNIKVGEYTDNAQLIATATEKFSRKSLYDALGKDQYDNIKDGKTALYAYEDGVETRVTAANLATYMDRNDTSAINNSGNGSLTQVYLNDDGANDVVRVVTSHTYVWQVTNDYNATRGDVTIKAVGLSTNDGNGSKPNDHIINLKDKTLKDDDFEAVKGLKKDDYVLITAYKDGTGYEVDSVAKAELKTGKVDSFTKADTVTIDGTKTKYSNMAPGNNEQKGALYTVGEEARFVMDKYGYVIAVDELVVNNNYVFVANIASTGGLNTNPEGDAYFTDGTNEAIRINKVGTDDGKNAILGKDVKEKNIQTIGAFSNSTRDAVSSNAGWYTYSKASNGKYNLNKLSSSYLQVGYVYNAATDGDLTDVVSNDKVNFLAGQSGKAKQITAGLAELYKTGVTASTLRANDKTIFVVEQDGDVNVYTGLKNAPNVNLASATSDKAVVMVAYDSGNSYAKYVYITLTDKAEVDGGQNTALFYVLKRDTEDVITDQKDYEMWYVIDENGKDVLVKTDTSFMNASTLYRAYYKTFKNSDDEYTKVTPITDRSATIKAALTNTHYIEAIGLKSKNGDTNDITYNNGSLFVGGEGFTTTSDTKIILVIQGNGAKDMKVNTDKKYEIENYTNNGDGLEQKFNDYSTYTYDVQGRIGGNYPGDTDLKEIYITVTAATKIPSGSSGTVYSDKISRDAFIGTDAEFMQTLQAMLNKGNVTITDSNVVLPSGYTLIVPADTTLTTSNLVNRANITIWGDMVVNGNLDDYGHIDNRGSLKVTGTDNNIGGASIVTYAGATTAFTSDKAVVKVTGALTTEGSLTIGAEGKTTAKLEIASGAKVTFAATADVTVEGNLDVKAGATVTAKNTNPIIVAGAATVAADTATNNGSGTGVIAVGDSSNSNIADNDLTKTSTDLVNAVANAKTAVEKCVKTYQDNEFVKKAVADKLNLNSKDSDLTTAANNAISTIESKSVADQVKELASYDEDEDTCSGTQINTIKSAGEALVDAAKTAVKNAAKTEITNVSTKLDKEIASAEKVAENAKETYTSAISKATGDVTNATTVAAVTKAVNDAKTAGTTLTTAVKAAEADEIARVQALLEENGVTIDKDTQDGAFANVVATAIKTTYKNVTATVTTTTGGQIDTADLTDWKTAGVDVLVTLTCGTTAASQGFAVTVKASK